MHAKGPFLCKGLPDLHRARLMKFKLPLYRIPSSSSSRHSIRFTYRYCTLKEGSETLKICSFIGGQEPPQKPGSSGLPGAGAAFLVLNETSLKVSISDLKTKPGIGIHSFSIQWVPAGGWRHRRGHQNGLFTAVGLGTDHETWQRCYFDNRIFRWSVTRSRRT